MLYKFSTYKPVRQDTRAALKSNNFKVTAVKLSKSQWDTGPLSSK